MGLNFPASPAVGQSWPAPPVAGVPVYQWDGIAWSTHGVFVGDKVVGPAAATDKAAARFDLTTGKLIKNSALLIDDITGKLSAGVGGVPILGRTNGIAPAAGEIGEIIKNLVPIGSGVPAVSGSGGQLWNSINLPSGVWLGGCVTGVFGAPSGGPTFTHMHASYGLGISGINTAPGNGDTIAMHITSNNSNGWLYGHGCVPFYLPSGGTINAYATTDFSGGTAIFYGNLWAMRIA